MKCLAKEVVYRMYLCVMYMMSKTIISQGTVINQAERPFVYLSVCLHSICVSQLSHELLHVSKWFLCLVKCLLSGYFKFVITSWCGIQLFVCSGLKENNWRKLKQHSTENHRKIAELVERMISKHEAVSSNPGSKIFSFCIHGFFNVRIVYKHTLRQDLGKIKRTSSGNSNMFTANQCLLLLVLYSVLKAVL